MMAVPILKRETILSIPKAYHLNQMMEVKSYNLYMNTISGVVARLMISDYSLIP